MQSYIKAIGIIAITVLPIAVSCKKEYSCEGCLPGNQPPIANAGRDTMVLLPLNSVKLDGSASFDPDGAISSYKWTKISGPVSLNIVDSTKAETVAKSLVAGTYQFELKVTDDKGLVGRDTVEIIVNAAAVTNHPPVANAGADQAITLPLNTITLDGNGSSDPDNNIINYLWTKISGPTSFNIQNLNAKQTQVNNLAEGIYQFELKVTDAKGVFSKDTMQVVVNSTSAARDANAGPDIIITLPLDSVYLEASTSSLSPATFHWTNIAGPSAVTIANTGYAAAWQLVLVTQLIPGLCSFKLEVTTATGTATDTVNVLVVKDPQETNTITFKNLKWHLADEYGLSIIELDIVAPAQPNLFIAWNKLRPCEVYLQIGPNLPFVLLPLVQSGITYSYDAAIPYIWVIRTPREDAWIGRESSIKVKLL